MKFFSSNETIYRLLRTAVQAAIGVVIANLDMLVGRVIFDPIMKTFIVGLCMSILSPIMAEIGKKSEETPDA